MRTSDGSTRLARVFGSSEQNGNGWIRWVAIGAASVGAYVAYRKLANRKGPGIEVRESVTIERPIDEIYRFWRELGNLPKVMDHLESVEELGDGRSHWVAKGPAGSRVEWDAQTTLDRENEVISWRSADDATVPNEGSVRFQALGDRRTNVLVTLNYHPPGGAIGAAFANLFGEAPSQQVGEGLHRLKQDLEAGKDLRADEPSPSRRAATA